MLNQRGVGAGAARVLATYVYACIRGLQLDLLATGDRPRIDAAVAELARSVAARLADGGDDAA